MSNKLKKGDFAIVSRDDPHASGLKRGTRVKLMTDANIGGYVAVSSGTTESKTVHLDDLVPETSTEEMAKIAKPYEEKCDKLIDTLRQKATEESDTPDPFNASGSKYLRPLVGAVHGQGCMVDVYAILKTFDVRCPARQHAIKKLLCAGLRGKASEQQDLKEARDAVDRAMQLADVDGEF